MRLWERIVLNLRTPSLGTVSRKVSTLLSQEGRLVAAPLGNRLCLLCSVSSILR